MKIYVTDRGIISIIGGKDKLFDCVLRNEICDQLCESIWRQKR
ncbi:unnamed protein product [Larinioides sclopetarius]|uniref:Uncharacterized protein n=1 Tax=Larinioides sclopetarius TaxID=280406 RepID=A0AAV2BD03_9ARAC